MGMVVALFMSAVAVLAAMLFVLRTLTTLALTTLALTTFRLATLIVMPGVALALLGLTVPPVLTPVARPFTSRPVAFVLVLIFVLVLVFVFVFVF